MHCSLLLFALLLHLLVTCAVGHSYLISPMGNFKSLLKAECRVGGPPHAPNDNCPGPCINQSSWQYKKDISTLTYSRGQLVKVLWARNNHHGGFIRFSIVPDHLRMSHEAHDRLAFHYSCFDSGSHNCSLDACGGDRKNIAFRAFIRIPTIYPDGFRGVLAWTWFGGLEHTDSYFGDYWSCRNIHIQGGHPLNSSHPVTFKADAGNANFNFPALGKNSCLSSVDDVRICTREPCRGRNGTFMRPAPFSDTEPPLPISTADLHLPSASPTPTLTPSPSTLNTATSSSPSVSASLTPSPAATVIPPPTVTLSPVPTPTPSISPRPSPSTRKTIKPPPKVLVSKVSLVDIDTMKVIEQRFYRTTTIPRGTERMTFIAETVGRTAFVNFTLDDHFLRTERYMPYTAFGDKDGVFGSWTLPVYDSWLKLNVSATGPNKFMNYKVYWMRLVRQRGDENGTSSDANSVNKTKV